jgi:hypothetical protein
MFMGSRLLSVQPDDKLRYRIETPLVHTDVSYRRTGERLRIRQKIEMPKLNCRKNSGVTVKLKQILKSSIKINLEFFE